MKRSPLTGMKPARLRGYGTLLSIPENTDTGRTATDGERDPARLGHSRGKRALCNRARCCDTYLSYGSLNQG
jgi:hypothetical protein